MGDGRDNTGKTVGDKMNSRLFRKYNQQDVVLVEWAGKGRGVRSKRTPKFLVLAMGQMESSFSGKVISSLCVC